MQPLSTIAGDKPSGDSSPRILLEVHNYTTYRPTCPAESACFGTPLTLNSGRGPNSASLAGDLIPLSFVLFACFVVSNDLERSENKTCFILEPRRARRSRRETPGPQSVPDLLFSLRAHFRDSPAFLRIARSDLRLTLLAERGTERFLGLPSLGSLSSSTSLTHALRLLPARRAAR